jgi:hypothetical protein
MVVAVVCDVVVVVVEDSVSGPSTYSATKEADVVNARLGPT